MPLAIELLNLKYCVKDFDDKNSKYCLNKHLFKKRKSCMTCGAVQCGVTNKKYLRAATKFCICNITIQYPDFIA